MDAAGIERAAIVGCSIGGEITIDFALQHPERVSALVLVAPGLGGFKGTPEDDAWWGERQVPIEAAIEAGDLERAEDLRLEIWGPPRDQGRRGTAYPPDRVRQHPRDDDG